MSMETRCRLGIAVLILAWWVVGDRLVRLDAVGAVTAAITARQQEVGMPRFEVDPFWPDPLPNNWTLGAVAGVHVDAQDHVWIVQRPNSLTDAEIWLTTNQAVCCAPAPSIIEFDQEGTLVQAWGGPGVGFDWPENGHGIFVDHTDSVWTAGNGRNDSHVLKFTRDGRFLLQIGRPGMNDTGSNSHEHFNRPAQVVVDQSTNEAYVADGYGNRRVVVFDADTGAYKRHWGAYGERPDDAAPNAPTYEGPLARQFNTLHGVQVAKDGLVYVADRRNNRIQVFQKDGTFVKEGPIARETRGFGVAYELAFSADPGQQFIYVADGTNNRIWIVARASLDVLGYFGQRGRYAGQFHHSHSLAVDSLGNVYVGETQGKRLQKFTFQGIA